MVGQRYDKYAARTNFPVFICYVTCLYFIEIMLTKFANKGRMMYLCRQ